MHHAIVNIIEPIFDKTFIYDSCANRKGKGSLFAISRFDYFKNKVTNNGVVIKNNFEDNSYVKGYCLKADIKHYFQEIDHSVLIDIIKKKINDEKTLRLIELIISNNIASVGGGGNRLLDKGMPLGNLTSQFFANVYLNELDYFVKHHLKVKYYVRYVDDFVILHESKAQLEKWEIEIDIFLKNRLKLQFHPQKSKIIPLSKGIDFVGFRNFYDFRLLRARNIRNIKRKLDEFKREEIEYFSLIEVFQGWNAYARWADSVKLRKDIAKEINSIRRGKNGF